jgi:hypothetical protein
MPDGERAAMGRLNRVRVATSRGAVEISWQARSALLDRLRRLNGAGSIRYAFLVVGATRPVELSTREVELLVDAIDDWEHDLGAHRLPADVWKLRNALAADPQKIMQGP